MSRVIRPSAILSKSATYNTYYLFDICPLAERSVFIFETAKLCEEIDVCVGVIVV